MAMRSASTAARSSRSLAVSGQVPRATSTVKTSTATPSSPLTLAARTSMPLRASAPATEERRPRRSGAATMTWGGWSDTDGSPVWRTSSMRSRLAATMRSGRGRLGLALEHAVGALDEVGDEAGLPGAPGGGPGGPAVRLGQGGQQVRGSAGCRRRGRRGRWWWGRRGRAGWPCRAAGGGGARGRRGRRRRRAGSPCACAMCSTTSMPTVGVVAGEALADVVEEGADQEEVGPLDPVGQLGGERGGLEEVPVDGEACGRRCAGACCARRPTRG